MTTAQDTLRFHVLRDLGRALAARVDVDELLPVVLTQCRNALQAENATLLVHDPADDTLAFAHFTDCPPKARARLAQLKVPADRGIAGQVFRSGDALRIDDAQHDARFFGDVDREIGITTHGLLTVPLAGRGTTFGVLQVLNRRDATPFTDDDLALLEAIGGSVTVALEAARLYANLKAGAERLETQVGALRRDLARHTRFDTIIGEAAGMDEVYRLMESAAGSDITVLIEGETGTGKELVARGVHTTGARAEGPFLAINCAAVPETLLASELFGHRRGAFTGATADRRGLFESARGGTVFLDEIGETPAAMQASLLRVLEEREIVPVGETTPRTVDVRVIAATNRDLRAEATRGAFREDLYYRLAAFPIRLPPLRERRDDVPLLAERFVAEAAHRHGKQIEEITPAAIACLRRYDWPGNVRELRNDCERAVVLAKDGEAITPGHLAAKPGAAAPTGAAGASDDSTPAGLREARAAFEAGHIAEILRQHDNNVSRAARALGISRTVLQRKMKEHDLR